MSGSPNAFKIVEASLDCDGDETATSKFILLIESLARPSDRSEFDLLYNCYIVAEAEKGPTIELFRIEVELE